MTDLTPKGLEEMLAQCEFCTAHQIVPPECAVQCCTDLPAVVKALQEARGLLRELCDGISEGRGWTGAYDRAREFLGGDDGK
jgi:hypothetical protein